MKKFNNRPGEYLKSLGQKYISPVRVFAISVIGIFMAEVIAMVIIQTFSPIPFWLETLLDATIMILIVFPVIYFYSFRQLMAQITERKRGEVLLSKVLENLPVGVWIIGPDGKIMHGNNAAQEIWKGIRYVGTDQYEEYKGWWVANGAHIKPEEWAASRAISKGESILKEEVGIECFDGTQKIILNSALPIFDEGNQIQGAIVVNEDITSRKHYEQELIATNELLERVFFSIDTHIAYLDREFNFIRVNDAYARAAQHPPEFFVGKNHFDLYPHEENQAIFQRVVDTGEPFLVFEKPFEYAEFPELGVTYWDWSLQPVRHQDGTIQGLVMSLVDVTERKRAEKQLEKQNQELLVLSESERTLRQMAEGIAQASLALNESLEMETVLDRIFEVARRILRFSGANINLVTEDNRLHVVRSWGFEDYPQARIVLNQTFPIEKFPLIQETLRTQKPLLIEDTTQNPGWTVTPGFEWVRASVIAPLVQGGEVIGTVTMFGDDRRVFSHEIESTIMAYAAPAATAIRNARLFNQEQRARQQAEGILQATMALNKSLEMETVLDRIFEVARHIIPFTGANIGLVTEDERLVIARSWGFENQPQAKNSFSQPFTIKNYPIIQEVVQSHKPQLIEDVSRAPDWVVVPGLEWVRAYVIAPLVQEGKVIGTVSMYGDDVRVFSQEIEDTIMAYASPAAIAIHNARLFDKEQHTRQVAETLRAASLALTQSLDIHVVLERLLEQAQNLIPYDVGVVALTGEGERLNLVAIRGSEIQAAPLELLNRDFQSKDYAHIHRVIVTRQTHIVPDTREYPGWNPLLGDYVRNWLGVPLFFDENTLGILWMIKTRERFFTQEHASLAEALVGQASVAIQNAWLFEQVRSGHERLQSLSRRLVEVQESERRYIARELHDETSQALTALKFGLHHLEQDIQHPDAVLVHLGELKQLTDGVLVELHRLAMDLRPASLDHLGLVSALEQLASTAEERFRMKMNLKTVGISEHDRLPSEVETALYRIVQEALTNVSRHAKASRVDVVLELRHEKALLVIEDDGVGFDVNGIQNGHLGILGMQERAQMAGGSLQIESSLGGGTTIVAEVPYENSNFNRR